MTRADNPHLLAAIGFAAAAAILAIGHVGQRAIPGTRTRLLGRHAAFSEPGRIPEAVRRPPSSRPAATERGMLTAGRDPARNGGWTRRRRRDAAALTLVALFGRLAALLAVGGLSALPVALAIRGLSILPAAFGLLRTWRRSSMDIRVTRARLQSRRLASAILQTHPRANLMLEGVVRWA